MKTLLTFGTVRLTRLTLGETRLSVSTSAPAPQTLTLLNIGVPGPAGEGIDAFTGDPLAYYILAKN